MADLLTRFIQDMQLRNFFESTIRSYSFAVRQLADHFNKSPILSLKEVNKIIKKNE